MSAKRDALANVSPAQSIRPQAVAATVVGEWVEVRGYEEVEILLDVGLYTDGTFTWRVEHSSDGSSDDGDVAASYLDGTFPTLSAANDNQLHRLGYQGDHNYIRVVAVEETSPNPTGCVLSATVQRRRPQHAPVS